MAFNVYTSSRLIPYQPDNNDDVPVDYSDGYIPDTNTEKPNKEIDLNQILYSESDIKTMLSRFNNNNDEAQIQPVTNLNQSTDEPEVSGSTIQVISGTTMVYNRNTCAAQYGCSQYSQCANCCTVLGSTCVNYKSSGNYNNSCSNWLQNYANAHSHKLME